MVTLNRQVEILEHTIKTIDNRIKRFRVLKLLIPDRNGSKNIVAYFRKSSYCSATVYELKNDEEIEKQIGILENEKQELLETLKKLRKYCV